MRSKIWIAYKMGRRTEYI